MHLVEAETPHLMNSEPVDFDNAEVFVQVVMASPSSLRTVRSVQKNTLNGCIVATPYLPQQQLTMQSGTPLLSQHPAPIMLLDLKHAVHTQSVWSSAFSVQTLRVSLRMRGFENDEEVSVVVEDLVQQGLPPRALLMCSYFPPPQQWKSLRFCPHSCRLLQILKVISILHAGLEMVCLAVRRITTEWPVDGGIAINIIGFASGCWLRY